MNSIPEIIIDSKINRLADPMFTIVGNKAYENLQLRLAQTVLIREIEEGQPNVVRIHTNEAICRIDGEYVRQEYFLEDGRLVTEPINDPYGKNRPVGLFKSINILAKIALGQKIKSKNI